MPTGNSSDGGYPSDTGYGHEEWNFQFDDAFKGNLYGYTYYKPPDTTIDEAGGHFKIGFWSRHPDTGLKLLVGIYHDATLVSNDETSSLYEFFESNGIFDRRAEELVNVAKHLSDSKAAAEVRNSVKKQWIHWKCPISKVEFLSQYIQLPDIIGGKVVGAYFTNPTFIDSEYFGNSIKGYQRIPTPTGKKARQSLLAEDAYYRESAQNLRVIIPRHNQLSNQFCKWLKTVGITTILQEQNQVDVSFDTAKGSYLAELKVCYGVGTTKSIREALGQLFEYNFYSWRNPAKNWLIVLDEEPSKIDRDYIQRIVSKFCFPLLIGWKSGNGFTFDNQEGKF
jgi:hypothetical protein